MTEQVPPRTMPMRPGGGLLKIKFTSSKTIAFAVIGALGATTGCGSKVEGSTYEGNGGVIKVEFKSGGKAYMSAGPATTTCTYTESGKTVTLICVGDKTVFTVEDDALNGPPDGLLTRLTRKK
jgi:hypothetical protein